MAFHQKTRLCGACGHLIVTYEEKESDVNPAVRLVEDAAGGRFDTALILSADRDLCPAVRSAKRLLPRARVIAAFPPRRHSGELARTVDASFAISTTKLRQSQLPETVVTTDGIVLTRPTYWKR